MFTDETVAHQPSGDDRQGGEIRFDDLLNLRALDLDHDISEAIRFVFRPQPGALDLTQ